MSDRVTGQTAEVIVLGAGIVGVSAAYRAATGTVGHPDRSARAGQRNLLWQRRYSQQRLDIAAQQSVALERAAAIPGQPAPGAALGSCLVGSQRGMDRPLPGQCDNVPCQTEGGGAARADRRVPEAAQGMDRESECGPAHPRDRLAESMAQRRGGRGKGGTGLLAEFGIGSELL